VFRAGLLTGTTIALTGGAHELLDDRLGRLDAQVAVAPAELARDEDQLLAWAQGKPELRALVHDSRPSFAQGGTDRLQSSIEEAWIAARAVATGALLAADEPGKLVFVAPAPDAGEHAQAARAALENLSRTLSVEWARFRVTAVTIWPGTATTDEELADLASFLVSEAGGYFTGCRFELGSVSSRGFISAS